MSELRKTIGDALGDKFDRAKLDELLDSMLAVTKQSRGWCPNCNKAVMVEINDSKAVAGILKDLNAEAWGRPQEDKAEEEGIVFNRSVVYSGDDPEPRDAAVLDAL